MTQSKAKKPNNCFTSEIEVLFQNIFLHSLPGVNKTHMNCIDIKKI